MALGTAGMVVAAAVVAGAVGAGTAVLLRDPALAPSESAGGGDGIAALQDRVDRQEKEIRALRARLEETAGARGPAPQHPPAGRVADGVGEEDPLDPPPSSFRPGTRPDPRDEAAPQADLASLPPEERAKYEAVYKAMREKEQEEGRKARLTAYEAGLRSRLDRLPEQFGLTADQKEAAVKNLMARGEKLRAVFEEARTAGGAEAYRAAQEKAEAIRKESRDTLAQSLTMEQVKAVEQVSERGGTGARAAGGGNRGDGGARRNIRNNGGGGGNQGGSGGGETPPR